MTKVSASILNCDHTRIAQAVLQAQEAGADRIHVDIMDGVYCQTLSFGPGMVSGLKKVTHLPVDVHLELQNVETFIPMFIQAGADTLSFQLDACPNPLHALRMIRQAGVKPGLGIGPSYTLDRLPYLLKEIDFLILMSVEPGYGGQPFEAGVLKKIEQTVAMQKEAGTNVSIMVDGCMNDRTAPLVRQAGADTLIVGTHLFGSADMKRCIQLLKGEALA